MLALLTRLAKWLWGLRLDKRWRRNVYISLPLTGANFGLVYYLVSQRDYNSLLTNVSIGIAWAGIWYTINRWGLWKETNTEIVSSAGKSFAWWAITFGLHQVAFIIAITLLGFPLMEVRTVLLAFGLLEFFANYQFKDKKVFVPQRVTTKSAVAEPRMQ